MNFKSMKQKFVSGLLAGALLFTLPGATVVKAATPSAADYLKQMNTALSKAKSYTLKQSMPLDMSITVTTDGKPETVHLKLNTTSTQVTVNKPDFLTKTITKQSITVDDQSQTTTQKMYTQKDKKGNILCYLFADNAKKPEKTILKATQMNQLLKMADLKTLTNAKVIDDNYTLNNKKVVKLSAELTGETLQKSANDLLKLTGIPQDEETQALLSQLFDFSNIKPIQFVYYMDKKTHLPVKCTSNIAEFLETYTTDLLTKLMQSEDTGTDGADVSFAIKVNNKDAVLSVSYKDYNKTSTIKLPSSCK